MNKEELLDLINSWENLAFIIKEIAGYPEHFDNLMDIALHSPDVKSWRAAWMIDKINDKSPDLIVPYIPALIEKLPQLKDSGKRRHFLKLISLHDIPEDKTGFIAGFCLDMLSSAEPPAIRVHAMQVLFNISETEKDFKPELLEIIEHEMEFRSTPGILARGTKLAGKLRKQVSGQFNSLKEC